MSSANSPTMQPAEPGYVRSNCQACWEAELAVRYHTGSFWRKFFAVLSRNRSTQINAQIIYIIAHLASPSVFSLEALKYFI